MSHDDSVDTNPFWFVFVFLLIFIIIVVSSLTWIPHVLAFQQISMGEVTSVSVYTSFGITTTSINFKDGSTLRIFGKLTLPLGSWIFKTHSDWFWIQSLDSVNHVEGL